MNLRRLAASTSLLAGAFWVLGCGGGSSKDAGQIDGPLAVGSGGTEPPGGGGAGLGGGMVGSGGLVGAGGAAGSGGSTTPSCGQPGTQCCDGNACSGGGCCVSGICMAVGGTCVGLGGGVCNAGACGSCGAPGLPCCGSASGVCTAPGTTCNGGSCMTCGDLGQPCCAGAGGGAGVCAAPGTTCSAGSCSKCGDLGQPCCAGSGGAGKCNAKNAICGSSNVCLACGIPAGPCCPGNACDGSGCCYGSVCAAEGTACGTSAGICQAGRCSGCGSASQPCCVGQCYDSLMCKAGTCTPCGGMGQACCSASAGATACQDGMACTSSGSDGVCARCGNLGDVCCAGQTCTDGCCSGGRCLAPGTGSCPSVSSDAGQPDVPGGGGGGGSGGGGTVTGSGGASGKGGTIGSGGAIGSGGTGTIPPWTPPAGCGDGVIVSPEQCDDGNTMPFDGCSSDCRFEPTCVGQDPCTSKCGDGLVVGEECDDGNTAAGDGCSPNCKVEPGFVCTQPDLGDRILVPVVYRDFRYHSPTDFEPGVTGVEKASTGMVEAALNGEGKPVYTGLTGSGVHVASKDSFASWYGDQPVNHATASKLTLWSSGNGTYANRWGANGEQWPITEMFYWCGYTGAEARDLDGNVIPCSYQLDSGVVQTDCDKARAKGEELFKCIANNSSLQGVFVVSRVDGTPVFFPLDGDTFTPTTERTYAQIPPPYDKTSSWPKDTDASGTAIMHNFSFTSEFRYWFKFEPDRTYQLDITGDDDVWVFVNKQLAVDIGGIHTPASGSVTLDSSAGTKFGLVAGNVYEVAVFQAERQSYSSTFKITLAGFNSAPSECHAQ